MTIKMKWNGLLQIAIAGYKLLYIVNYMICESYLASLLFPISKSYLVIVIIVLKIMNVKLWFLNQYSKVLV